MPAAAPFLIEMLLIATLAAVPADAVPATSPKISDARNAAAGFAISSSLHVVELTKLCEAQPEPTHTQAVVAREDWAERNLATVTAAHRYTQHVVATARAQSGDAAAEALQRRIAADLTAQAASSLRVVFPDGRANAQECARWAGVLVAGDFDLRNHAEFAPVLDELLRIDWPDAAAQ